MTISNQDRPNCDVLIVGGGLVGASLACALEGSGLRVVLAEASAAPRRMDSAGAVGIASGPPAFDERNLALARASCNALDALGVWRHLRAPPSPIGQIHVSSRGDFGAVRIRAMDYRLDRFGAVVVARELGHALETRLEELCGLQRLRPARVLATRHEGDQIVARIRHEKVEYEQSARLLVAADGTASELRTQLGIQAERRDYEQTLFVATAQFERAHGQVAYERFTATGPVALLPLAGPMLMGSVCTVGNDEADAVAALDDNGYRDLLQQRFGWRLGRVLRVGPRRAYPLQRVCAKALTGRRAVLIGNAAQTLHPIGAQGFNLGLRDALILAEELRAIQAEGGDPGDAALLQRYAQRRRADRESTLAFTDQLVRFFAQRSAPLRVLRSLGLFTLDRVPGLMDNLVCGAMGFRGDVPMLAFGKGASL